MILKKQRPPAGLAYAAQYGRGQVEDSFSRTLGAKGMSPKIIYRRRT